jgi:hypothetical protein
MAIRIRRVRANGKVTDFLKRLGTSARTFGTHAREDARHLYQTIKQNVQQRKAPINFKQLKEVFSNRRRRKFETGPLSSKTYAELLHENNQLRELKLILRDQIDQLQHQEKTLTDMGRMDALKNRKIAQISELQHKLEEKYREANAKSLASKDLIEAHEKEHKSKMEKLKEEHKQRDDRRLEMLKKHLVANDNKLLRTTDDASFFREKDKELPALPNKKKSPDAEFHVLKEADQKLKDESRQAFAKTYKNTLETVRDTDEKLNDLKRKHHETMEGAHKIMSANQIAKLEKQLLADEAARVNQELGNEKNARFADSKRLNLAKERVHKYSVAKAQLAKQAKDQSISLEEQKEIAKRLNVDLQDARNKEAQMRVQIARKEAEHAAALTAKDEERKALQASHDKYLKRAENNEEKLKALANSHDLQLAQKEKLKNQAKESQRQLEDAKNRLNNQVATRHNLGFTKDASTQLPEPRDPKNFW